ncbi:hypothetical protein ASD21_10225 [Caulobacter sp. Root1455]|nr:hypothetical protein ASD21_10225 [Caulobacter sp. Root1455]
MAFVAALASATAGLAQGRVDIRITPETDGLRVAYSLPRPVERFEFDQKVEVIRQDTWRAPDDMMLAHGVLRRKDGKPFEAFQIQVVPDTAPRDRSYPALTRVGAGWQVYGPYFRPVDDKPPVVARVIPPRGWIVTPSETKAGNRISLDGWAFVGPGAYATRAAATLIASPAIEADLAARIAKAADGAAEFYGRRLDVRLEMAPTVIATRVPTFNAGWQGDVSGPVVSLRFFGPDKAASEASGQTAKFVDHEFFHLWNNRVFHSRDGDNEAWLHEGMAEYAALLAGREQGELSEAEVGQELADRLNSCVAALRSKGLAGDPPRQGKAVYDCGVVAQWSADLKARAASAGRRDVFDVWRALFAASRTHDGIYDAQGFLALAGQTDAAEEPLRLLMAPDVEDRWGRLTAALNGLGARIVGTRSVDAEQADLLFHLERLVCNGSIGFYGGYPKGVKLDTGDRCGPLNGDPMVDTVAGHDVLTDVLAARDAVVEICAARGEVTFTYQGKLVATVACKVPLGPRPLAWNVETWRQSHADAH